MFSVLNVHEGLQAGICSACLSAQTSTQPRQVLHIVCDVYEVLVVLGD
jgi:hypothetical protein